ncbi:UPF0005-domain-containing protein [Mycena rebaudengoi]|nr:UPF0005-domain-containing protein [Mycena rebaudengoi]
MSQYPVSPPAYGASGSAPKINTSSRDETREPLLGSPSHSGGGGIFDQPEAGDVPDDFKYGTTVSESSPAIRQAFVRKVYSILLCQIVATVIVGGILSQSDSAVSWVQSHIWAFYCPACSGTSRELRVLVLETPPHTVEFYPAVNFHPTWKVSYTPLSFTLGIVVAFYENGLVLKALLITLAVFFALTAFTFQSKYDFEGMGPFLFGGLMALCMTGFIQLFIPFNSTMDLIYAIGGCLIFSGYILSPDEFIMGAISLYLDFINLFLSILRLLNNLQER